MLIWVYNYHQWKNQNNTMFENPKIAIWDDLMKPFQILKELFNEKWHNICSVNDYPMEKFDALLFVEFPTLPFLINPYFIKWIKLKKKMYLLLMESELIRPSNFNKNNHKYFEKVFTWKDDIIDDKKYIKIYFPQNIKNQFNFKKWNRKLCTLIASHKLHDHNYELYSERIKAIRFFEKNNIDFDLYWFWWDKFSFKSSFINLYWPLLPWFSLLKKILNKFFLKPFPSWKWSIENKNITLSKYKFAICYENASNISWYITEKIFDCFYAWCIPIYLGPPNIDLFIPKNTYINKNDFITYEELYHYISKISHLEYNNYLKNIQQFIEQDKAKLFSSENFSQIIYKNII